MSDLTCKIARSRRELQAHFAIRKAVFVDEQNVFENSDVDLHDRHGIPIVAIDEDTNEIVGAVRCYRDEGDIWIGGRLAVEREHRGRRVGAALVKKAEAVVKQRNCRRFLAHVQVRNVPFFKLLGWRELGDPTMYHGLEHQRMETEWSVREPARPSHWVLEGRRVGQGAG